MKCLQDHEKECFICGHDFTGGGIGSTTYGHIPVRVPCGHAFCQDCIVRWLLVDRNEREIERSDFRKKPRDEYDCGSMRMGEYNAGLMSEYNEEEYEVEGKRMCNEEPNIEQTEASEISEDISNLRFNEWEGELEIGTINGIPNIFHEDQVLDRVEYSNSAMPEITSTGTEISRNREDLRTDMDLDVSDHQGGLYNDFDNLDEVEDEIHSWEDFPVEYETMEEYE